MHSGGGSFCPSHHLAAGPRARKASNDASRNTHKQIQVRQAWMKIAGHGRAEENDALDVGCRPRPAFASQTRQ